MVVVELPEGSLPVGPHPSHQLVLQGGDVRHRQGQDLILEKYSSHKGEKAILDLTNGCHLFLICNIQN